MSKRNERKTKEYLGAVETYLMRHYPLLPIVIAGAKGCIVTDTEGVKRYDAIAGYGADIFGHGNPELMEFCRRYFTPAPNGDFFPSVIPNAVPTTGLGPTAELLAQTLTKEFALAGSDTKWKCLFSNGGVEAVEAAIKIARKWGAGQGRTVILTAEGNFHGRTTTVVGFSSEPKYKVPFGPYAEEAFREYPYGDITALEDLLKAHKNIAAVLVEPIQGEGGVRIPSRGYLKAVRELCTKYGVLLIADEIQTGFWRTGKFLASLHEGVVPDILIMAKALGGGIIPVSAVAVQPHCDVLTPGEHGSTYGGNSFAMAVAGKVLECCENEDLRIHVPKTGEYLLNEIRKQLAECSGDSLVKEVRGIGLMVGIELKDQKMTPMVLRSILEHSVLTNSAHGVIRITPPLIIKKHECKMLARHIAEAFAAVANVK